MITLTRFSTLLLSLLFSFPQLSHATVNVVRYPTGTPVKVCQPSDTDSTCGGSGISGLTTNYLVKASSATAIANSRSLDNGTSFVWGTNLSTTALDEQTFHNTSALSINYVPSGIGGIDSYVKLMQHLNNSGVDSSFLANTMTNNGTIAFTNTDPPFTSTYWAVFNGAGTKSFTTPTSSSFDLSSSDATFDWYVKFNSHTADGNFISQGTDGNNFYSVQYAVGGPGNRIQFYYLTGGVIGYRAYALFTPVDGTHYHIAVQFTGSTLAIFINGTSQAIVTATGTRPTFPHYTSLLRIGNQPFAANDPDAEIAEMRFSVGIARYSGNFTPNTTPYTSESSTPTLKMYGNGSLLGYISIANATNIMSIVNNGLTGMTFTSASIPTFPQLTSNGVLTTSGGTGLVGVTATTGSGNVVLSTSPTLTTPILGVAAGTSLTLSAPGTSSTDVPNLTSTNTLTNKTLSYAVASSGGTYKGNVLTVTSTETQAVGDAVQIDSGGKAHLAKADVIANASGVLLAAAAVSGSASNTYLLPGGTLKLSASPSWTVGGLIFLSTTGTTGNTLTQTAPSGTNNAIQLLGVAIAADTILFMPSLSQVEHT